MLKIKVAGTPLDRRSKAAWRRHEIVKLYNKGYKQKEIAQAFHIHPLQVYRYLHYDKYLEQCRKDSARYVYRNRISKNKREMFEIKQKVSNAVHQEYIQYLMQCKNKFKPSIQLI